MHNKISRKSPYPLSKAGTALRGRSSEFRAKTPPQSHPSQKLFAAYNRVQSYIRNLNTLYDMEMYCSIAYDQSLNKHQQFVHAESRPQSSAMKPSYFPKSQVSRQLLDKLHLIKAYNNISSLKPSRSRQSRPTAFLKYQKKNKHQILGLQYYNFFNKLQIQLSKQYCQQCKRTQCVCESDVFLERVLNKQSEALKRFTNLKEEIAGLEPRHAKTGMNTFVSQLDTEMHYKSFSPEKYQDQQAFWADTPRLLRTRRSQKRKSVPEQSLAKALLVRRTHLKSRKSPLKQEMYDFIFLHSTSS